jgi:tetratricopeptide (TPR) repeat protein
MQQPSALRHGGEPERPALPSGYSTRDVASLLGLTPAQVRSCVRAGFLSPLQGPRGEYYFSFQDLILLRTAKGLLAARVPRKRIRLALDNLRAQLPQDRALTGVRISAQGHHVVVRDGRDLWIPESGQTLFDFELSDLAREASTLPLRTVREERERPESASDWYERACELEDERPQEALAAYRRALELDPNLGDAHLNLGHLLHERGDLAAAELHYRRALELLPEDPTAAFNLGVVLQDSRRFDEAVRAYEAALEIDPSFADAHYNLAGLYERTGEPEAAFRHLRTYKTLTQ